MTDEQKQDRALSVRINAANLGLALQFGLAIIALTLGYARLTELEKAVIKIEAEQERRAPNVYLAQELFRRIERLERLEHKP